MLYGWTLHYCLDELTFRQAIVMWRRGIIAHSGPEHDPMPDDEPDLERFHELYGDKIKRG